MRIAITGAVGIGKTTLASALSAHLKIPLLKEDFGEVVHAFNMNRLPDGSQGIDALNEFRRKACMNWLRNRQNSLELLADCVQDRCAIDILQRWLTFNLSGQDNELTLRIIRHCRQLLDSLDWLVIPPLSLTPEQENEDRLVRSSSLGIIFRGQSLTIGIAQMLIPGARLLLIPPEVRSVQERLDYVVAKVH